MVIRLCVGTKKGAFILDNKQNRSEWNLQDPIYFGNIIYHFVPDTRNHNKMIIAAKTGHLGPTIFFSDDSGNTWTEANKPPAFQDNDRSVNFIFWISPGHSSEPDVWYAGTSPQGLFKSEDGGMTWNEVAGFANNELIKEIVNDNEGTPIGPLLHSINIDPRDKNHI